MSRLQEQQEPAAREDREDFATDAPRGDCEAPEGGFSQRFPPSRGGLRTSASSFSHRTNRRWAASAAAAQPRIEAAEGGATVRDSKWSAADARVRVRYSVGGR